MRGYDFLTTLRTTNAARCDEWANGKPVDVLFHAVELAEEVGEVIGAVKKIYRESQGWRGSVSDLQNLKDEIGDVMICLDHIARVHGIDIESATIDKFNATSEKHGFSHRL